MGESSMIERVARAIYETRNGHGCVPWSRHSAAHKRAYLEDARAAILAMREPSIAMTDAALGEHPAPIAEDDGERWACHD